VPVLPFLQHIHDGASNLALEATGHALWGDDTQLAHVVHQVSTAPSGWHRVSVANSFIVELDILKKVTAKLAAILGHTTAQRQDLLGSNPNSPVKWS
jgi:hypothetical protein